jgi:hypothetical protein
VASRSAPLRAGNTDAVYAPYDRVVDALETKYGEAAAHLRRSAPSCELGFGVGQPLELDPDRWSK